MWWTADDLDVHVIAPSECRLDGNTFPQLTDLTIAWPFESSRGDWDAFLLEGTARLVYVLLVYHGLGPEPGPGLGPGLGPVFYRHRHLLSGS